MCVISVTLTFRSSPVGVVGSNVVTPSAPPISYSALTETASIAVSIATARIIAKIFFIFIAPFKSKYFIYINRFFGLYLTYPELREMMTDTLPTTVK